MAENTLALIDPELVSGLDLFPPFTLTNELLTVLRAPLPPGPEPDLPCPVRCEEIGIPRAGEPGEVRLLVYTPEVRARPSGAYLHIHGGGYVMGTPEMNDPGNRALAARLGCVVASVDYRLAPETRYPGALEDCYVALGWMHAQADHRSIDPLRIAVGGESAGGGHAAALAFLAHDRGAFPICHAHLTYPMLDDRTGAGRPENALTGEYIWTAHSNHFGWSALLGRRAGDKDIAPEAVPARRASLTGFPPTFIGVGALDLFLDEDVDFARRLLAAGIPVELHLVPGAYHGFEAFVPDAAVSRRFIAASRAALGDALA